MVFPGPPVEAWGPVACALDWSHSLSVAELERRTSLPKSKTLLLPQSATDLVTIPAS